MFGTGRKLNGFNNGRDTIDGIGGGPAFYEREFVINFIREEYTDTEKRALLYASGINDKGELQVDSSKELAFLAGANYILNKYNIKDDGINSK